MTYYQEITLIPSVADDIPIYFLWSKVFQQVHLALVETLENDKTRFGLAFPGYQDSFLGCKLRVFANSENELQQLDLPKWLSRLTDYVHITSIRPVPDNVKAYAKFSRFNKSGLNKEYAARRRAKRKNETYEQALEFYKDWQLKKIREPFIRLESLSNGQEHCLFIKKESAEALVNEGFSSYGLSKKSSVPDF